MNRYNGKAHGPATVASPLAGGMLRPECHAASGYSVRDYSGTASANGTVPREIQRDMILSFWEAQGIARWVNGGAGGGGRWMVRDMVNGGAEWLTLATRDSERDNRHAEFSHIIACVNGGAWCACNLLPEAANMNAGRPAGVNITGAELSPGARAVLAAWPTWWETNRARKASLARLGR